MPLYGILVSPNFHELPLRGRGAGVEGSASRGEGESLSLKRWVEHELRKRGERELRKKSDTTDPELQELTLLLVVQF